MQESHSGNNLLKHNPCLGTLEFNARPKQIKESSAIRMTENKPIVSVVCLDKLDHLSKVLVTVVVLVHGKFRSYLLQFKLSAFHVSVRKGIFLNMIVLRISVRNIWLLSFSKGGKAHFGAFDSSCLPNFRSFVQTNHVQEVVALVRVEHTGHGLGYYVMFHIAVRIQLSYYLNT